MALVWIPQRLGKIVPCLASTLLVTDRFVALMEMFINQRVTWSLPLVGEHEKIVYCTNWVYEEQAACVRILARLKFIYAHSTKSNMNDLISFCLCQSTWINNRFVCARPVENFWMQLTLWTNQLTNYKMSGMISMIAEKCAVHVM